MRTFLTTLLTAVLTALIGVPALQPSTILAGDEARQLEEKAAPTTLEVGEIRLTVEKPVEAKAGERATFTVTAVNTGDKKGKATARARVMVTPRAEEFSRMMPISRPVAELQIQASLFRGGTQQYSLVTRTNLDAGATVSVLLGEGDRWVEAANYTVAAPPAAEPAK